MSPSLRELSPADIGACAAILDGLPEWFGLPASNRAYIDALSEIPAAVAVEGDQVVGFVSVRTHFDGAAEIEVAAIDRAYHHRGIGRALVDWAEACCRQRGIAWLHVKTRGPSTPDPAYEKTRLFWIGVGFDPLYESMTEWGEHDAALILVKRVEPLSS